MMNGTQQRQGFDKIMETSPIRHIRQIRIYRNLIWKYNIKEVDVTIVQKVHVYDI